MARQTKEKARETREKILDAASCVFFEKGVAGAGLEEIAERAGVTRGAVYWHFKNKIDLFEALHDALHEPFLATILENIETDHPEPLVQLQDLCVELLNDLATNERKQRALTIFFIKCDYTGDTAPLLRKQEQQNANIHRLFERYFERALKRCPAADACNAKCLATGLLCYLTGIAEQFLRYPGHLDLKKQSRQLMHQFFQGTGL